MLSIHSMASGGHKYYTSLGKEDYYLEGGEPPGLWLGRGAKILGLNGTVKPTKLKQVFSGMLDAKTPLVQNAGYDPKAKTKGKRPRRKHRPGWDLTFSAPKSVSVLYSQAPAHERDQIRTCVRTAVEKTVSHIESEFAVSRTGKKGSGPSIPVRLVVAAFEHSTSRELDPQLHWHALVMNLGVDDTAKCRTLETKPIYRNKMAMGAFFRLALAVELERELGLKLYRPLVGGVRQHTIFQIAGVPQKLCQVFSKRREKIVERLKERGLSGAVASAVAALDTRPGKGEVPPRRELFDKWQDVGRAVGFDSKKLFRAGRRRQESKASVDDKRAADDLLNHDAKQPEVRAEPEPVTEKTKAEQLSERKQLERFRKAFDRALVSLTEQQNHFTATELETAALGAAAVSPISPEFVLKQVRRELISRRDIVSLGAMDNESVPRFTTNSVYGLEGKLLGAATRLSEMEKANTHLATLIPQFKKRRSSTPITAKTPIGKLFQAVKQQLGPAFKLDDEQCQALLYLAKSKGRMKCISGVAGAGKTALLSAARELYERAGYEVIGATPTRVAAKELSRASGIKTESVRKLCLRTEQNTFGNRTRHHAKMIARQAMNFPTWKFEPLKLTKKSVVVIDEAAMVSLKDMHLLVSTVEKAGGTVVLVGDRRQLPSIEAGGGFGMLAEKFGGVHLETSRRQKSEWQREVAGHIRKCEVDEALEKLAEHKALHVYDSKEQVTSQVLSDWKRAGGNLDPVAHEILANTQSQVDGYNRECQKARKKIGHVFGNGVTVRGESFHSGDRIRFNVNSNKLGVANGTTGTVRLVVGGGLICSLWIQLDGEKLPRQFSLNKLRIAARNTRKAAAKSGGKPVRKTPPVRPFSLAYASTITKSQGRTIEHAYFDASEGLTTSELAYVAMSRQKLSVALYTTAVRAGAALVAKAKGMTNFEAKNEVKKSKEHDEQQVQDLTSQMQVVSEKTLAREVEAERQI